jgi:AcrR family transcriptional regulator
MNKSKNNLSADKRRIVTIKSVIALAGKQNPNSITTAAIAQHMGLTQGSIFRHFSNKEVLFRSVMEYITKDLTSQINDVAIIENSAIKSLEKIFFTHINFIIKYPGIPRILFGELQKTEKTAAKCIVQTFMNHQQQQVKKLIKQGISSKEFNSKIDPKSSATLFNGMIQGLVIQSLITRDLNYIKLNASKVFAMYKQGIIL